MTPVQVFSTLFLVPAILACMAATGYNAWLSYRWRDSYRLGEYLRGVTWFWFCAGGLTLLYGRAVGWW